MSVKAASAVNRQRLVQYFFFGAFLLVLYQVLRMLSPFYIALLGAGVLALLVYPLHRRVRERLTDQPDVAAGVTTGMLLLGVVLPALYFGSVFLKETSKLYPVARDWLQGLETLDPAAWQDQLPPQARTGLDKARGFLEFWHIDLRDILLKNLAEWSAEMAHLATILIRNLVFVAFNLVMLTLTLFFFLRDGPVLIGRLVELVPMAQDHKQHLLSRIQDTAFAVIRGVLVIALVQGTLTGIGLAWFGVPFPVLLGALTTLVSPIPFVGIGAVIVPVVGCLLITGAVTQAVYVTLWCALIVGTVDNLLRPFLISAHAGIPILLLFFGILGGLRVYGPAGLLIGPLLVALVLAFINIYRQEYRWLLTDKESSDA